MPRIAVGGTFEFLHDGHKVLLQKALDISGNEQIDIGLTSDAMAQKKGRSIPDYNTRVKQLEDFLESCSAKKESYTIQKLEDPYGTTLTKNYDYIVVSPETLPIALKINEIREQSGLKTITIVEIGYVLAEDDIPISSTRIVKGEIDSHGKLKGTKL